MARNGQKTRLQASRKTGTSKALSAFERAWDGLGKAEPDNGLLIANKAPPPPPLPPSAMLVYEVRGVFDDWDVY